ncbi:MAG: lysophospholipid acyltransferase family protein [Polyangiaceae bacterium]
MRPEHLVGDLRFAGRAAGSAGFTLLTLARFEVESRLHHGADDERLIAEAMRRYGRFMCGLYGVHVETGSVPISGFVSGRDDRGRGRVFVVNHRSGLDIIVTLAFLEGKHVSRADLAGWPIVGPAARRAGILFVDRESRRSGAAVVQHMIENIERGLGVIIFPEGTTFAGDEVRPFKPGAFAVARRTECEIVPVGIAYGGRASSFDDEPFMAHMRRVASVSDTRVGLVVGDPLRAKGRDSQSLAEAARQAVAEQVARARALAGPAL